MAIAAQRYTFLDQQTNVPVAGLISQQSSDILNSAQNDLKEVSQNLTNLLNTNAITPIQNALSQTGSLSSVFSSLGQIRITKDFFSSGINLTSTPATVLSNAAKALAGTNTSLSNALSQLSSSCSNSILGGIGARKVQNPLINCSSTGMSRSASLAGRDLNKLSSVISQASGGTFSPSIYNGLAVENATSLLGIAGYKAALCNVFASLTANMSNIDSISRIASNMIGATASSSDIKSVIDIGLSLTKGSVTNIIPGAASLIFSHYQQPADTTNNQLPGLYNNLNAAMNNIDPNWATDTDSGLTCCKNLGGSNASNFKSINDLLTASASSTPLSLNTSGSVDSTNTNALLLAGNQFAQSGVNAAASSLLQL